MVVLSPEQPLHRHSPQQQGLRQPVPAEIPQQSSQTPQSHHESKLKNNRKLFFMKNACFLGEKHHDVGVSENQGHRFPEFYADALSSPPQNFRRNGAQKRLLPSQVIIFHLYFAARFRYFTVSETSFEPYFQNAIF